MRRIDLNVDIAEGFPNDEALLKVVTSANICCGEHAGSWQLTAKTVEMCKQSGVRYGSHPGFPDRKGMGRDTPVQSDLEKYESSLFEQVDRFVSEFGGAYIKPHGAWYNLLTSSSSDPIVAWAQHTALLIAQKFQLPLMLLANNSFTEFAHKEGIAIITEGFADRAYTPFGTLVPRSEPNAVLNDHNAILRQATSLAARVDSLCLHGDTPGCVTFAESIREALTKEGFEVGT